MSCEGTTTGLTFNAICENVLPTVEAAETKIKTTLESTDTLTNKNLLALQIDVQIWSIRSNLVSSVIRVFGDTLRGIVQKIA